MKRMLIAASLVLGLAVAVPQAQAVETSFLFTYNTPSNGVVSGVLLGELQADLNTVFVSSIESVDFGGSIAPALPFVDSLSNVIAMILGDPSPGLPPIITLDGSVMDICAGAGANDCITPLIDPSVPASFFMFDSAGILVGAPIFYASPEYGGTGSPESYFPTEWHATPVPATLPLVAIGAVALAWQRRRAA